MKQTAVQWLIDNLEKYEDYAKISFRCLGEIEIALELEKEQIIDAHIEGQRVFDKHPHSQWTNDQAEQHYNETYVSKDIALQNQSKSKAITELSDEEIEKAAAHHEPMITRRAWVSACKWYREQLKNKL